MKKFFGKIPIVAIAVIVGVCSVSLTAYAYYRLQVSAEVSAIQTASAEMLVKMVTSDTQASGLDDEEESYIESYKFTGKEGEKGATFSIVCSGTASNGYCEVIIIDVDGNEQSYYTPTIVKGGSHYFTILGNKDIEVQFLSHWGSHDITEETLLIESGEEIGTFVPVATASPSPSPSVSPSPSPSVSPSPTTSVSPSPSATPSATPTIVPSTSPNPSETPTAAPSEVPVSTPAPTAEVSGNETATPTPSPAASESASPTPEVSTSATPSPKPEVSASATPTAAPSEAPVVIPTPTAEVSGSETPTPTLEATISTENDSEAGENNNIENSNETGNDTEEISL